MWRFCWQQRILSFSCFLALSEFSDHPCHIQGRSVPPVQKQQIQMIWSLLLFLDTFGLMLDQVPSAGAKRGMRSLPVKTVSSWQCALSLPAEGQPGPIDDDDVQYYIILCDIKYLGLFWKREIWHRRCCIMCGSEWESFPKFELTSLTSSTTSR